MYIYLVYLPYLARSLSIVNLIKIYLCIGILQQIAT